MPLFHCKYKGFMPLFQDYAYTNCRFSNLVTVSKCMLYMPTEEELQNKIERQKNFYRLQHTEKSIE